MILFCWFPQTEMKSEDVDSEMDDILKEAQETNPEGEDTSDTENPKILNSSSSWDSPNFIEAITLLQKALAVHGVGGSGQADTTDISSKLDRNKGSTYNEYFKNMKKEDLL